MGVIALSTEKPAQIKSIIADILGFKADEIQSEDRFIADYSISYGERKQLLEKLNADFGKEIDFAEFCKWDKVEEVISAFAE
jgi:acyl carrier protein